MVEKIIKKNTTTAESSPTMKEWDALTFDPQEAPNYDEIMDLRDAIDLCFTENFSHLISTTTTKDPIGPKLVKERSTNKEDIGARITRLRPIAAVVKTVLTEGCHRRGLKFEERAASATATTAAAATVTPLKRSRASSNFTTPSAKKPRAGTFAPMKKRSRKRCCVRGCAGVDQLTCVQPMPGPLPANASVKVQTSYNKRLWKRRETLRRLGLSQLLSPDDETKDLRFCKSHPWE